MQTFSVNLSKLVSLHYIQYYLFCTALNKYKIGDPRNAIVKLVAKFGIFGIIYEPVWDGVFYLFGGFEHHLWHYRGT